MFVNSHPDVTGAIAAERVARLLAEAEVERARRTAAAQWRPARFRQPTPDLQRAAPAPEAATSDRAA
jgi:hypothetical protein